MFAFRGELHKICVKYAKKVLIEDDVVHWTGSDLAQKIVIISKKIAEVTPEYSRIGLCIPNWASLGLAFLACIEARRVPVLLDYLEVSDNDSNWFQNKQLTCILFDDSTGVNVRDLHFPVFHLSRHGDLNLVKSQSEIENVSVVKFNNPPKGTISILYTSGSTGQSKGIFVPEHGVLKTVDFLCTHFKLNDLVIAPIILPICYSMALNTQFLPTLLSGGKSLFINSRLNFNRLYQSILESKGTFLALIGEILQTCWEEKNKRKLPPALHVQHIQLAGGTILPAHLKMAMEIFPTATIHKGYGLTEAIRVSMIQSKDPDFFTESVGKPLPFVDIEIRNEENKVVAAHQVGEICVKGPNVFLGICSRYAKVVDDNGFMNSGDLGYINDKGHLVILGRKDGVFKVHGRRYSGFIYEREAMNISTIVKGAKCVAVDDQRRLSKKIVLFLEIHKNLDTYNEIENETFDFIKKFERELKKHSFYPKDVVITKKLPRTNNGKVQLSYLKTLWNEKSSLDQLMNLSSTLKIYIPHNSHTEKSVKNLNNSINNNISNGISDGINDRITTDGLRGLLSEHSQY